jgi:hypothetical protein
MIEFIVAAKEFRKAVNLILSGRKEHMDTDTAEFKAVANMLELSSVGTETQIDAEVVQAGYARVPLPVLKDLKKVAGTYKQPRLHLRVDEGRFRIESYSLANPGIELRKIGVKMADLPVDAGFLDTLAMVKLFSAEEIAESGLAARVLGAQEKATAAIEGATTWLSPFHVPREEVRKLLEAQLSKRASEVKSNLRAFGAQQG